MHGTRVDILGRFAQVTFHARKHEVQALITKIRHGLVPVYVPYLSSTSKEIFIDQMLRLFEGKLNALRNAECNAKPRDRNRELTVRMTINLRAADHKIVARMLKGSSPETWRPFSRTFSGTPFAIPAAYASRSFSVDIPPPMNIPMDGLYDTLTL